MAGAARNYLSKPWDNDKLLGPSKSPGMGGSDARNAIRLQGERSGGAERGPSDTIVPHRVRLRCDGEGRRTSCRGRAARKFPYSYRTNGAARSASRNRAREFRRHHARSLRGRQLRRHPSEMIEAALFGAGGRPPYRADACARWSMRSLRRRQLFLDENRQTRALAATSQLSRVLETGHNSDCWFEPTAASQGRVRVMSAHNADIPSSFVRKFSKRDLYYRMKRIEIAFLR